MHNSTYEQHSQPTLELGSQGEDTEHHSPPPPHTYTHPSPSYARANTHTHTHICLDLCPSVYIEDVCSEVCCIYAAAVNMEELEIWQCTVTTPSSTKAFDKIYSRDKANKMTYLCTLFEGGLLVCPAFHGGVCRAVMLFRDVKR